MIKKSNKKWYQTARVLVSILFTFCSLSLGILYWYFFSYPYVKTEDARISADILHIAPSCVSGRIEKVFVDEGNFVKKGQVLAQLEQDTLAAQLDRAKAKNTFAKKELSRMQKLYKQTSSSQKELDAARFNCEVAASELALAEIAIKNSVLKSPIDGIVIQKTAVVGNLLEQGQTAISLADIKNAWVSANIEETKIKRLKNGQKVYISIDEGGFLVGQVENIRIATSAQFALIPNENTSGNFTKLVQRIPIKIKIISNSENKILKIGQSVVVKIRVI